jgi:2-polyprenyl-3-methyl-5-hydroxy-6-metoxy-1,4-benzoquinol methylase
MRSENEDLNAIRLEIAEKVLKTMTAFYSIKGKTVLDVGCKTGEITHALSQQGAIVYGLDPDSKALAFAINKRYLTHNNFIHGKLQELPAEKYGIFDFITIWNFNIPYGEWEDFFGTLAKVVETSGRIIIGINEERYINGDRSIRPWLEKYFSNVGVVENSPHYFKFIFNVSGPILDKQIEYGSELKL